MKTENSYTGQFLIAMPGMGDPRFERSLIYMCSHSDDGAMGLVVNHPANTIMFPQLLNELDIRSSKNLGEVPVHLGGPVEMGRGFVLHSRDYTSDQSLIISPNVAMTATLNILKDLAAGHGPRNYLVVLGYTGWGPGQLEDEMQDNSWHVSPANEKLIFHADDGSKWNEAMAQMGINAAMLSHEAGHA